MVSLWMTWYFNFDGNIAFWRYNIWYTNVDLFTEDLICAAVDRWVNCCFVWCWVWVGNVIFHNLSKVTTVYFFIVLLRSQVKQTLSVANSSEALCNLSITEHACSSVRMLYVNCESQRNIWLLLHYPPDTNLHKLWKCLFYTFSNYFPRLHISQPANWSHWWTAHWKAKGPTP